MAVTWKWAIIDYDILTSIIAPAYIPEIVVVEEVPRWWAAGHVPVDWLADHRFIQETWRHGLEAEGSKEILS